MTHLYWVSTGHGLMRLTVQDPSPFSVATPSGWFGYQSDISFEIKWTLLVPAGNPDTVKSTDTSPSGVPEHLPKISPVTAVDPS